MKHLIYFLLFSTVAFSQNYQYALEEAAVPVPEAAVVNNQLEEIEYFKAYLLPIAQKATIQQALDTYGSVRLEAGDYSGVDIVMHSNQKLYGHPSLTIVSNITIAAGSSNVQLQYLIPSIKITLQSGGVISGCTFKAIKYTTLSGTNVMFENNLIIDFIGQIQLDCSGSGYFRNNKIIKHQVQAVSDMLVMKGNTATPSYGNVHLHSNYLTPPGNTTNIDNLQTATFVGVDSEGWNLTGKGTDAMLKMQNMGNVKITDFGGANSYSQVRTPSFNIVANNLFFLNKYIQGGGGATVGAKTNVFSVFSKDDDYTRGPGTVTGFDFFANVDSTNKITYNGTEQSTTLTNSTLVNTLTSTILGAQYTPWDRPSWETLPDPLGANWKANRVGKTDQTAYIQNLIDTKGIAELPEGIFYIGSTLKIIVDNYHGIVGQGTGKTVLVGLTDDFPLISTSAGATANFTLAHLTLQGGRDGIYCSSSGNIDQQVAYNKMKYVVFRNQVNAIRLHQIMGFDNDFFDNVSFVNCSNGFLTEPLTPYVYFNTSSYVDKVMFYKGQFINCDTAFSLVGSRAHNLNAWVDCKFDGGQTAFNSNVQNSPIIANCDFTNYTGSNIIKSNVISIYSSNFYNNSVTSSTISSVSSNLEGCQFLDASPVFSAVQFNYIYCNILNSTVTGNIWPVINTANGEYPMSGIYSNSTFASNPTLSKLLVNVKNGVPTVVLDATPTPYPQLLVTQTRL